MIAASTNLRAQAPAAPLASTSSTEPMALPAFNVTADQADAYRPSEVLSVARIATDIMSSPMTVNVVTPELIQDMGANSGYDVTRYFSGVSNGRGTGAGGISDRQDFRGFESFSRTIDNFSGFLLPTSNGFQANWDPAFIERAELVMGPDSILAPTGTPGGSVNILTKSPLDKQQTIVSQSIGNYNAGKTTVDSTGPVPDVKGLDFRVIADYQDAEEYMPGSLRQWNASAQLTYNFSPTTKLTVKYFGMDWELTGAIADPNDNGEMVYTANTLNGTISNSAQPGFVYHGWNGDATWDHRFDRVNIAQAEFTTSLTDRISMRLATQVLYDKFTQDAAYPSGTVKETFDPNTGIATGLTPTFTVVNGQVTSMPEVAYFSNSLYRGEQVQNDFAGNFHPGPISIQPVFGWAYQQGHVFGAVTAQDTNPADVPNANLSVGYYDPPHPPSADYTFVSNKPSTGIQEQVYEMTRFGAFQDKLLLSAGVSRTWEQVNNYADSHGSGKSPTGPYTDLNLDSFKDNYIAGLLYKITPDLSAYYSFSTNAAITSNNLNQPVWQTGKQHEFGLKSVFFNGRLSISADHFQIAESNLTSTNPLYNLSPLTQPPVLIYDAVNHGYELNVVGGITKNLSIILSGTEMKYRDTYGRRYRNVPDSLANLLLNYHFTNTELKGLSIFAGIVHVGDTAGESVTAFTAKGVPELPSFFVPAWTAVNAGASYTYTRYRFNLNVDNALNDQFWWQPAGRNSVSPYPGITTRLTVTVKL
jgi:iron complex outermembrane receptor protein